MDTASVMFSLLFGTLGMGFLMYGKKAGRLVPIGAGLALMVFPCFIPNQAAMLATCLALTAIPFVVRNA